MQEILVRQAQQGIKRLLDELGGDAGMIIMASSAKIVGVHHCTVFFNWVILRFSKGEY